MGSSNKSIERFCPACDQVVVCEGKYCSRCGRTEAAALNYKSRQQENRPGRSGKMFSAIRSFSVGLGRLVVGIGGGVLLLILVLWLYERHQESEKDRYWALNDCYIDENCKLSVDELVEMRELREEIY